MSSAWSPGGEVAGYAADVRAALADVPEARVADLLEDLEEHLAEVAAESDEPLAARLGPPASYAEELRRSAGLPGRDAPPAPGRRARLGALVTRAQGSQPVREVVGFLPELRPAWWVARAWLGLLAVDRIVLGSTSFPLPTLGLGPVLGLLLTAAAITFSVRLGRRVRARPRSVPQPVAWVGNGLLALLAVVALVGAGDSAPTAYADPAAAYGGEGNTLAHEDGTPITNLHPYSATGEPLTGVLLYDQDGRPVDNLAGWTADGLPVERVTDQSPPPPSNAYPQQQRVVTYDEWGRPVPAPSPVPAVPTVTVPPARATTTPPDTDPAPAGTPTGPAPEAPPTAEDLPTVESPPTIELPPSATSAPGPTSAPPR